MSQAQRAVFGLAVLAGIAWAAYSALQFLWRKFVSLESDLALGLLTAGTTVLVATLTVMVGRYYERKKEIEAHFREAKIEMYDQFLQRLFEVLQRDGDGGNNVDQDDLVHFLRDWQRKLVVWGGAPVITAFFKWKDTLGAEPSAKSFMELDRFFRAVRSDLGLSNFGIENGAFCYLYLRHPRIMLDMYKENPNVTIEEVAAEERRRGLEE